MVVVDQRTAEKYWPGRDPLGQRVHFRAESGPDDFYEIVGVVGAVRQDALERQGSAQIYLPSLQLALPDLTFIVKSHAVPEVHMVDLIRHEVASVAPALALFAVRPMERIVRDAVAMPRFNVAVLGGFAAMALLLACVGLYGVVSHSVVQRRSEVGLRMALGATKHSILKLMIRDGLRLVGLGTVIGLGAAFALTRLLSGLFFEVDATDPMTFASLAAVMVGVSLFAAFLPAYRAARVDPIRALRTDA